MIVAVEKTILYDIDIRGIIKSKKISTKTTILNYLSSNFILIIIKNWFIIFQFYLV